jgi:hypothetical protein
MSLADRSYTTRYAQKRARILALEFNAARYRNQTTGAIIIPLVGPGGVGVADSDRAARALGQRRIWRETNPACVGTLPNDLADFGDRAGLTVSVNPPNAQGDNCCPVVPIPVVVVG